MSAAERAQALYADFLAGELEADGEDELLEIMARDQGVRERILQDRSIDGLLGQLRALDEADVFVRSVRERINAEGDGERFEKAVRSRRKRLARRSLLWKVWLPAAACLALVLGFLIFQSTGPGPDASGLATLENINGSIEIMRSGQSLEAIEGIALESGDRLVCAQGTVAARVRYRDENTWLELQGGADVRLQLKDGGKYVHLAAGTAKCTVAPQEPGRPFILVTPENTLEVIGTVFVVSIRSDDVRLEVEEGTVRVTRAEDTTQTVDVQQGFFLVMASDKPLKPGPSSVSEEYIIETMDLTDLVNGFPRHWRAQATSRKDLANEGSGMDWRVIDGSRFGADGPVLIQNSKDTPQCQFIHDGSVPDGAAIAGRFRVLASGGKGGGIMFLPDYKSEGTENGFGIRWRADTYRFQHFIIPEGEVLPGFDGVGWRGKDIITPRGTAKSYMQEDRKPMFTPYDHRAWHEFRIEYSPNKRVFKVDGREVWVLTNPVRTGGGFALIAHRLRIVYDDIKIIGTRKRIPE